jgi:cell wall-associated NlpC family hydrolase
MGELMRDILRRVSIVTRISVISIAIMLLGLIVFATFIAGPSIDKDKAALSEEVQFKAETRSLDKTPEDGKPKEKAKQNEPLSSVQEHLDKTPEDGKPKEKAKQNEPLSSVQEHLGELRAEESTAFQAYNNSLYELEQLEADSPVAEQQPVEAQPQDLEAKRNELEAQIAARKERFESVKAEKQAYLDSLSSERKKQVQAEQERRVEEARAEAAELREEFAPEAPDPAPIPSQPIQEPEQPAQVKGPENTPEPQPGPQDDAEETEEVAQQTANAAQYQPEVTPEETVPAEETAPAERSDPPPPPPEVAKAVVNEAADFIGTLAVDDEAPATPGTTPSQQETTPAGASADQYAEQQGAPSNDNDLQQPETTTQGQQPSSEGQQQPSSAPVTPTGNTVVAEGAKYYGTPYELGGPEACIPYEKMDCSCLTTTVYAQFGISLPDSPGAQMTYGTPVSGEPKAGDLVGWSEDGSGVITHVGIATGKGTTIHASGYYGHVTETPIEYIPGYVGARRLL